MSTGESKFEGVTALPVANVYFDGKVVSHTLLRADGQKVTLGLIYPGEYRFDTGPKERMDITAGTCRAKLPGEAVFTSYSCGESFLIPASATFDIAVDEGIAQYVCTFD